jgi:hypothetical protein
MHTGTGQIADVCIRIRLTVVKLEDPKPGNAKHFIGFILLKRYIVFLHACYHTGATSGTFVQVDDHTIFFYVLVVLSFFHQNLLNIFKRSANDDLFSCP